MKLYTQKEMLAVFIAGGKMARNFEAPDFGQTIEDMGTPIARYWVLQEGVDCDGNNRGRVTAFEFKTNANQYADEMNLMSDGLLYNVTDSWDELLNYCSVYHKDFRNYKTI